jgi:hypothetical protein
VSRLPAVVLLIYNRPEHTAVAVDALKQVGLSTLYVAADGPRHDRPDDSEACAAARAVTEQVNWPGRVQRIYRHQNRGCGAQVTATLDDVLSDEERVIVIEDDVDAHPFFFAWCARMLLTYEDVAEVAQVSGRNELGRWRSGRADHIVARRGSIWGWGTWARAWASLRSAPIPTAVPADLDPLLLALVDEHRAVLASGQSMGWDQEWTLKRLLSPGLSAVAPVNLIRNTGFGTGASHTVIASDVRATLDFVEPPHEFVQACTHRATPIQDEVDDRYDRWSLLLELMASYVDPEAARRLAHASRVVTALSGSEAARIQYHLTPFREASESRAVLEHMRPYLSDSPVYERLVDVMARNTPGLP